jgi:hypothetical protein
VLSAAWASLSALLQALSQATERRPGLARHGLARRGSARLAENRASRRSQRRCRGLGQGGKDVKNCPLFPVCWTMTSFRTGTVAAVVRTGTGTGAQGTPRAGTGLLQYGVMALLGRICLYHHVQTQIPTHASEHPHAIQLHHRYISHH